MPGGIKIVDGKAMGPMEYKLHLQKLERSGNDHVIEIPDIIFAEDSKTDSIVTINKENNQIEYKGPAGLAKRHIKKKKEKLTSTEVATGEVNDQVAKDKLLNNPHWNGKSLQENLVDGVANGSITANSWVKGSLSATNVANIEQLNSGVHVTKEAKELREKLDQIQANGIEIDGGDSSTVEGEVDANEGFAQYDNNDEGLHVTVPIQVDANDGFAVDESETSDAGYVETKKTNNYKHQANPHVDGEEGLKFTAHMFERNKLLDYDGPTYNFELCMLSLTDTISAQKHIRAGKAFDEWKPTDGPVTIAETGSTVMSIQSVMIDAVTGPMNNAHRVTSATSFQLSLAQPLGASLTNIFVNSAVQLGLPDGLKATYLLKLKFIGRDPKNGKIVNPIPDTERQFLINIVNVEQQVDTTGAVYGITAVRTGDQATYQHVYSTDRPMELSNITTIKDMMEKLAEAININELDKLAIEKAILDEYYIHIDEYAKKILSDDEIVPTDEKQQADATQYQCSLEDGKLRTFKIPQDTGLNRIMEFALSHSKALQNLSKGFDENDKDPDSTDSARIKKYKKYIFKIKADVVNIGWDSLRNEYAREYHYTISLFPTIRPEILMGTYADQPKAAAEKVKELMKEDFGEGKSRTGYRSLRKRYDYIFTGLNDKVLRFDIKYNNNFFMAMHSYQNIYDNLDQSVKTQITDTRDNLREFKEKQSQVRAAWKNYLTVKADNFDSPNYSGGEGGANLDPSQATFNEFKNKRQELIDTYVSNVEDGTIEGDTGLIDTYRDLTSYEAKLKESRKLLEDNTTTDNNPQNNKQYKRMYAELINENELREKISSGDLPVKVMWGVTRDADAGAFNSQGHPGNKGKNHFDAVMQSSLSDFSADMVQMDMEIRGDMYWLESEGDPRALTASYFSGENYLLFRAITSAGEPDINTGIATPGDTKKEQLLNGVYAVVNVTSKFEGGLFTQNIKGPRETFIYDTRVLEQFEEK